MSQCTVHPFNSKLRSTVFKIWCSVQYMLQGKACTHCSTHWERYANLVVLSLAHTCSVHVDYMCMYIFTSHGNMATWQSSIQYMQATNMPCFRPVLWLWSHHRTTSPHSPMYIHSYIYFPQSYWMLHIYNVCIEDCQAWWLPVGCSSVVLAAQTRPYVCSMPL